MNLNCDLLSYVSGFFVFGRWWFYVNIFTVRLHSSLSIDWHCTIGVVCGRFVSLGYRQRHRCHFPTTSAANKNRTMPHSEQCCWHADSLTTIHLYFSSAAVKSTQHNTELQLFELQSYGKNSYEWNEIRDPPICHGLIHWIHTFYAQSIPFSEYFSNANRKWAIFFTLQIKLLSICMCPAWQLEYMWEMSSEFLFEKIQ